MNVKINTDTDTFSEAFGLSKAEFDGANDYLMDALDNEDAQHFQGFLQKVVDSDFEDKIKCYMIYRIIDFTAELMARQNVEKFFKS